jgi:hypothetical protein
MFTRLSVRAENRGDEQLERRPEIELAVSVRVERQQPVVEKRRICR